MEELKKCVCCCEEKPVSAFYKNAWGVTNYCTVCHNKRAADGREKKKQLMQAAKDLESARALRLEDFTPRELMAELKRRGYDGTLKFTRVETIDISKL